MPRAPSREDVQTLLLALLMTRKEAYTVGVPVAQLDQDYREQESTRIPFRALGYTCLLDLLESYKNVIRVTSRGGMYYAHPLATEKSQHVSQLVAGQNSKRSSLHSNRRMYRPSQFYPRVPQPSFRLDSATMAEIVRMVKDNQGMPAVRILEYVKYRFNYNVDSYDLIRQLREISHEIIVDGEMIFPASRYHGKPLNKKNSQKPNATENSNTSNSRPAGFSDHESDCCDEEFAAASADREVTQPSTKPEEILTNEENGNVQNEDQPTHREKEESIAILISDRTRFRLQKLIEKHPDGIWCADLPALYQQEYTIPLNYEDLGFSSVIDYAAYLPEIFHCARPCDKGDFKLYDAKITKPNVKPVDRPKTTSLASMHNIYDQYIEPTEPIPSVLCQTTVKALIPDGVMTIGETVGQICVTELNCDIHDYIDVIVSDVFTPSFFWIQLWKRIPRFNRFMDELHDFYEKRGNQYLMPLAVMEKGMNCACMYDSRWHRGIVKKIRHESYVTVMFYDYGTVKSYPPECIHFLHRSFSNLPAQAIPCGLYNLKPLTGTRWPRTVACEFVAKAINVPLIATIASIDTDNNSMMVGLTNTEGNEDFHINDWMVQSGLAIYGKMVRIRPPNYPFRRYLESNILKSSDSGKPESGDSRNVDSEQTTDVVPVINARPKYYEKLLKLCRESKDVEKTSILSMRESHTGRKSVCNDHSRMIELPEGNIVEDDYPACEPTSHHEFEGSIADIQRKPKPRLRREVLIRRYQSIGNFLDKDNANEEPEVVLDDDPDSKNKKISFEEDSANESADLVPPQPLHFANTNEEALTEFGTFRSQFGGHGRMENIDWSKVRETLKSRDTDDRVRKIRVEQANEIVPENEGFKIPETKVLEFEKRSSKPVANDRPEISKNNEVSDNQSQFSIQSKLPTASAVFSKIIKKIVTGNDENSNVTCLPEGNTKTGSKVKPWLRAITGKLNENRERIVKIFVPDSILELMRNAANSSEISAREDKTEENGIVCKADSESLAEMSPIRSIETSGSLDRRLGDSPDSPVPETSTSGKSDSEALASSVQKTSGSNNDFCQNSNEKLGRADSRKDINAWLKTVQVRPRNQRLFNFIASRQATRNHSELDSDDLSTADPLTTHENNKRETPEDSKKIQFLPNSVTSESIIHQEESPKSGSSADPSGNVLKSEISELEVPKNQEIKTGPIFDDVDMESDSNTWDGWCGPKILDNPHKSSSSSSDSSQSKIDDEGEQNYRAMDETAGVDTSEERDQPTSDSSDDKQPLIKPNGDSGSDEEY